MATPTATHSGDLDDRENDLLLTSGLLEHVVVSFGAHESDDPSVLTAVKSIVAVELFVAVAATV